MTTASYVSFSTPGQYEGTLQADLTYEINDTSGQPWSVGWAAGPDGVHLKTDPYGLAPLFVADGAHQKVVSNSLILAAQQSGCTDADDTAMAVFIRYGSFLGNDTPFKNVRAVPPGADFNWAGGQSDDRHFSPFPEAFVGDVRQAGDTYRDLFAEAIKCRAQTDENILVPLTGGCDSRHIAFELARQKVPIYRTFTTATLPEEAQLAARIARALNVPHAIQPTDELDILKAARQRRKTLEYVSFQHMWAPPTAEAMKPYGGRVFDGLAGDTLSNSSLHSDELVDLLRSGKFAAAAEILLGKEDRLRMFAPALVQRWNRGDAIARMVQHMRPLQGAPNPLKETIFWSRTRREISQGALRFFRPQLGVSFPYLDTQLATFLRSLPAPEYGPKGFHDDLIARSYPQFADIPFFYEQDPEAKKLTKLRHIAYHATALRSGIRSVLRVGNPYKAWLRFLVHSILLRPTKKLWWLSRIMHVGEMTRLFSNPPR